MDGRHATLVNYFIGKGFGFLAKPSHAIFNETVKVLGFRSWLVTSNLFRFVLGSRKFRRKAFNLRAYLLQLRRHCACHVLFKDIEIRSLRNATISEGSDRSSAGGTRWGVLIVHRGCLSGNEDAHRIDFVVLRHVAMTVQRFDSEDVSACQCDESF